MKNFETDSIDEYPDSPSGYAPAGRTLTKSRAARRCGALAPRQGPCLWRVWSPKAEEVHLVLIDGDRKTEQPMMKRTRGFFEAVGSDVPEGQRYFYRINDGRELPDPCSLWQPDGVHGPSAVVRPELFAWSEDRWHGVQRADLVLYELHIGTFTAEGTFAAAIARLPLLKELGITAIEVMPVGQFPGKYNWGYDGVGLYAAQNSYGGPHEFQRFVDACHALGMAVILDVVYNHLGPEGNYLSQFGSYFTDRYKTPWGLAINYDDAGSDAVRDFIIDNARMWLKEFHLDGLRLDAVHAIYDQGARHILRAIKDAALDIEAETARTIHIIAESDLNDPRILRPVENGGYGLDAQWADDFHHALHAFLTGERAGYYADFGEIGQLVRVLQKPFLYEGEYSRHRDRRHGAPATGLSADRFVVCLQNHDQVGNRAAGERLTVLLPDASQRRLATSLHLLSPYLPLIFMGEEYGETRPFPFFCSFCDPGLIEAVREGRKREFAEFISSAGELPDPNSETTVAAARLGWEWTEGTRASLTRRLYQDLLKLRREITCPGGPTSVQLLPDFQKGPVIEVMRTDRTGREVHLYFNLSERSLILPVAPGGTDVVWSSESIRYGGERSAFCDDGELRAFECAITVSRSAPLQ